MATPGNLRRVPARTWLRAAAAAVLAVALAACASAPQPAAEAPPAPVVRESRTGVPFLMDLPGVGWLFQRRVTQR